MRCGWAKVYMSGVDGPGLELVGVRPRPGPALARELRAGRRGLPGLHALRAVEVGPRDLPRLEDREPPLREAPLDVLRKAEVRLDAPADLAELAHALVGKGRAAAELFRHRDLAAPAALVSAHDHEALVANVLIADREGSLLDEVLVRIDASRHHCFPETPAAVQEQLVRIRGDRVRGEEHAGDLGGEHLLHDHRDPHGLVAKALALPVGDRAGGPPRRPAASHVLDHGLGAQHVQVGVVLPCEGRPGQVFGRCG